LAVDSDIVMITAIGAKPRRVIHNIKRLQPGTLVILNQLKRGWSENDREYRENVLKRFYRSKHIKELDKKERLDKWPVQDLADDRELFHQLFRLLRKYADYPIINIDTTAMPRRSTIITTVVASMFPNVHCWAAGKKGYGRYSLQSYPNPNEEGSDPVMIPLLRRDIALLKDPSKVTCQVFKAVYNEFLNRQKKGLQRIVINKSYIGRTMKDQKDKRAVTQAFTTLENEGWLIYEGMNNYKLSPFAVYLGATLEEEKEIEYEGEAHIQELITEKEDVIRRLAQKFKTYPDMNEERIKNWLLQFPSKSSAQMALKLLERVEYIDMQKIRDSLQDFYEKLSPNERNGTAFVIMGRLADSSDLILYYLSHEVKGLEFSQLNNVLTQGSKETIFFLDDCLISGTQAKQIFGEWLGMTPSSKYVTKLTDAQVTRLKQLDIKLHVIIGTEEGKKELTEYLQKLGCTINITASRTLERESDSCFVSSSSHSGVLGRREEVKKAKQDFHMLGKKILLARAKREDWSTEQLEKNCLGYGDWQLLLVFQHNTPTGTLPIFWERAYLDGREWFPLFPRR
jgi:hypothetical protein